MLLKDDVCVSCVTSYVCVSPVWLHYHHLIVPEIISSLLPSDTRTEGWRGEKNRTYFSMLIFFIFFSPPLSPTLHSSFFPSLLLFPFYVNGVTIIFKKCSFCVWWVWNNPIILMFSATYFWFISMFHFEILDIVLWCSEECKFIPESALTLQSSNNCTCTYGSVNFLQ